MKYRIRLYLRGYTEKRFTTCAEPEKRGKFIILKSFYAPRTIVIRSSEIIYYEIEPDFSPDMFSNDFTVCDKQIKGGENAEIH